MPGYGGEAGDLLLKVKVGEKQGFERKGMDVYSTITIPFTTAVFGGEAPYRRFPVKLCAESGKESSRELKSG